MRINTLYHHIPTISQRSKAEMEGEKEGGKEKEKKEGEDRPGRDVRTSCFLHFLKVLKSLISPLPRSDLPWGAKSCRTCLAAAVYVC